MKAKEVYNFINKMNDNCVNINGIGYSIFVTQPNESTRHAIDRCFYAMNMDINVGELQPNKKYIIVCISPSNITKNIITDIYDLKCTAHDISTFVNLFYEV